MFSPEEWVLIHELLGIYAFSSTNDFGLFSVFFDRPVVHHITRLKLARRIWYGQVITKHSSATVLKKRSNVKKNLSDTEYSFITQLKN
jgi:hypothetical protein